MDDIAALWNEAKTFPLNFNQQYSSTYNLRLYEQLNAHAARLFSHEDESVLDFLELSSRGKGMTPNFWPTFIKTESRLKSHLGVSTTPRSPDPRCRFLFVHAIRGSSREKLQTTREMLMLCFTCFRAMPEFIDLLFEFGYQSSAQDQYFSSFRQRTSLSDSSMNFKNPGLAWSGSEIQLCYNLKSAEQSGSDPNAWSIRPCAIHHTFDVKNIRANWIVIKGNDIIKDHIEQATGGSGDISSFDSLDRAFAASLATHLIFCDWAAGQWRWHINNLEDQFQNASRKTLIAPVTLSQRSQTAKSDFQMNPRTDTMKTNGSIAARLSRTQTMLTEKFWTAAPKLRSPTRVYTDPESGLSQPLPPHITMNNGPDAEAQSSQPLPPTSAFENSEEQDFSFAKLQKIQHIEEKVHEALLILKLNISIIRQLKQYYDTLIRSKNFPPEIVRLCQDDLEQFELRIDRDLNDLQMQILRLETLLRLLGDRKSLLHSILENKNTQMNKISTDNMILMTRDMNEIARKTKIETVSMKVITLVTLFFLPGTFISTLMSTQIFQPNNNLQHPGPNPYAHLSPLQVYFAASLPLTFVTMIIWAALHWSEKHKEGIKAHAHKFESMLLS